MKSVLKWSASLFALGAVAGALCYALRYIVTINLGWDWGLVAGGPGVALFWYSCKWVQLLTDNYRKQMPFGPVSNLAISCTGLLCITFPALRLFPMQSVPRSPLLTSLPFLFLHIGLLYVSIEGIGRLHDYVAKRIISNRLLRAIGLKPPRKKNSPGPEQ